MIPGTDLHCFDVHNDGYFSYLPLTYVNSVILEMVIRRIPHEQSGEYLEKNVETTFNYQVPNIELERGLVRISDDRALSYMFDVEETLAKASFKEPILEKTPKTKGVLGRPRKKQSVINLEDVDVVLRCPVRDEGAGGFKGGDSRSRTAVGGSRGGAGGSREDVGGFRGGVGGSSGGVGGSRGGAGRSRGGVGESRGSACGSKKGGSSGSKQSSAVADGSIQSSAVAGGTKGGAGVGFKRKVVSSAGT
ncbi:hypothetical protein Tco_1268828 [Tanacetum coccineum]